jgi:tetratricopeptide (TPR) repeat protein
MDGKTFPKTDNSAEKDNNIVLRFVLIALFVFLCIKACFLFISGVEFWGINQLHYLSGFLGVPLLSISLVGIYISWTSKNTPKAKSVKEKKKTKTAINEKEKVRSDLPTLFILTVTFGILFLVYQVAWPFLGDGSIFVGYLFNFHVSGKMTVWWTEAPSMYLQYGIYHLKLLLGGTANSFFPFTAISFISGVLFVIMSFRFSKAFDKNFRMQWLLFALLLSAGGTLFFFGYMETYPLQYTCVLIYCYLSYRYLQNKTTLVRPALILLLCITLHLQNVLLLPSLIFLSTFRSSQSRQEVDRKRAVLRSLVIAVPLLLAIYLYFQWHPLSGNGTGQKNPFIPLFSSEHFSYTLFSGQHLLDILNENLLLAGVALAAIFACILAGYKHIRWNDPFLLYLLLNFFFFESFLIGGNVVFGLARDWDVCASLGIFITLLAVVLLKQVLQRNTEYKRFAIPLLAVALCTCISWVTLNIKDVSASNRYEDILELYTLRIEKASAQYGYENLRKYYKGGDPEAEIRTIRKIVEIDPRPADVRNALSTARENAARLSPSARSDIQKIVDCLYNINSDSIFSRENYEDIRISGRLAGEGVTLGDFYENGIDFLVQAKIISYDQALSKVDSFIHRHPSVAYGYEVRGYLMTQFGNDAKGSMPYLERALSIDPNHTRTYNLLGIAYALSGDRLKAKEYLRHMLELDPFWMNGLESYTNFLMNKGNEVSDTTDLLLVRQSLKSIIRTPPESDTKVHLDQHEVIVRQAEKLLRKVEYRMKELQTVH